MSEEQSKLVSQKQKMPIPNKLVKSQQQEKIEIQQKNLAQLALQNDVITTNHIDLMTSRSDGQRTFSRVSENMSEQMIPLSNQKREKSLSPIKRQNSIVIDQNHSVTSMRRNAKRTVQFQQSKAKEIQHKKTSEIERKTFQQRPNLIVEQQVPQIHIHFQHQNSQTQSIIHTSLKQPTIYAEPQLAQSMIHSQSKQEKPYNLKSSKKVQGRRTQIFSSDKKNNEKNLKLNRNIVAEQIFNLNKQERIGRHQIYQQLQRQNITSASKSKREDSLSLSRSKKNEMKKLEVISASPLKATEQYWEGIYPQSKRYINSLRETLLEEKQVLKKWQSDLQITLRENLYEVQEIMLQKLYEIARQCVKIWIHQELQGLQILWTSQFKFVKEVQQDLQKNEVKLQEYEKQLENFNNKFKQNKQCCKSLAFFEKGIYSPQISKSVTDTSQRVKQAVSKSQQVVSKICKRKLSIAKNFNDIQLNQSKERLDKVIQQSLKNLFKPELNLLTPKKQSNKNFNKKVFDIGQKIKMILDKSQERQPQTTRQSIVKQFQYSDKFVPYSHRKSHQTPVIKNNQKEFQYFKNQFEKRKRNFIDTNIIESSETKKNSHFQMPISQKSNKKTTFDQKLSNLFKKITQQKQQEPQDTNRSSIQTNYFNDYNDFMKKKKKQNRQNFFRYSIQ